jgi:hypothetical protein
LALLALAWGQGPLVVSCAHHLEQNRILHTNNNISDITLDIAKQEQTTSTLNIRKHSIKTEG